MKVLIEVTTTAALVPAATVAGKYRFQLLQGTTVAAEQETDAPEALFDTVADGDYVASVSRLGSDGAQLADAVTQAFTVTSPDISVDVPSALTITTSL
jgi:hypothetical protein